jgi:sugar lactone lactonase YvrE
MNTSLQPVLAARARLGECPLWDPERSELDWIDVYNQRVHQFDPATGRDRWFDIGDTVTAIVLAGSDRLLVALRDRLAFLHLEDGEVEPLCTIAFPHADTRLNDGKCDPQGRLWVGSMSKAHGAAALYRYDPDGSLHVMESGLTTSNGVGWSPDGTTFYLTDSPVRRIYAYRFDGATGSISDRRVFVQLEEEGVVPDGLTVDREGHIWSALWNGWCVVHFDADGREIERLRVPVACPTSVTFGGPALSDLYVTSASVGLSQDEIQRELSAGDLFRASVASQGMPARAFGGDAQNRIDCSQNTISPSRLATNDTPPSWDMTRARPPG